MQGKANSTTVFDLSPALPPQHVSLEVDQARQREYGRWLLVGLVLLGALLFNVWQRGAAVDRGYRLQSLERQRAEAVALGDHLRLEVESLKTPALIEQIAMGRLHLVAPGLGDQIVLLRIVPPPQPPSSVVALR